MQCDLPAVFYPPWPHALPPLPVWVYLWWCMQAFSLTFILLSCFLPMSCTRINRPDGQPGDKLPGCYYIPSVDIYIFCNSTGFSPLPSSSLAFMYHKSCSIMSSDLSPSQSNLSLPSVNDMTFKSQNGKWFTGRFPKIYAESHSNKPFRFAPHPCSLSLISKRSLYNRRWGNFCGL